MEVDYVRLAGAVCGLWCGWVWADRNWTGGREGIGLDWLGESGTGVRMVGIFVLFVVGFCFALLIICML